MKRSWVITTLIINKVTLLKKLTRMNISGSKRKIEEKIYVGNVGNDGQYFFQIY